MQTDNDRETAVIFAVLEIIQDLTIEFRDEPECPGVPESLIHLALQERGVAPDVTFQLVELGIQLRMIRRGPGHVIMTGENVAS